MSNSPIPAATTPPPPDAEQSKDPNLLPRRVLCWVVLALLGGTTVALGIQFILRTSLMETVPISFVEVPLLPLAAFPMTLFFMLWLDILFKSKIVND